MAESQLVSSRWWLGAAAWLLLAQPLSALDPRLSLTQYVHTAWTQSEGALIPGVNALSQTADGYLWMGTWQGLWRFDGMRFTRWIPAKGEQLADPLIASLAASATGGLWIGTFQGLQRLEKGHLTSYRGVSELTTGMITALRQDNLGQLWIGSAQSNVPVLSVLNGKTVTVVQTGPVLSLSAAPDHAIGAVTPGGLSVCRLEEGQYQCRREEAGMFHGVERDSGQTKKTTVRIRTVLRDRDGNVWVGTAEHGLYIVRRSMLEHFSRKDGLSSDEVMALMEDHEGNIWAGTSNGIDRFRDPKVVRWSTVQGLAGNSILAVCASRAGDLWVSSVGGALDRLRDGIVRHYRGLQPGDGEVLSLFEARDESLWAGTLQGVFRLAGDGFSRVPTAPDAPFQRVLAMAEDTAGTLWLADEKDGLGTLRNGSIVKSSIANVPVNSIYQMSLTRHGDVWLGYFNGGVTLVSGSTIRQFGAKEGLAAGTVQAIFEDHTGCIWIGTSGGLSRYCNGAWTTWTTRQGLPVGGVQGVIEDRSGRVWLITRSGIVAMADAPSQTRMTLATYGPTDGIRMREVTGRINPRVAMTADGRLWFGTEDGLASIDPAALRINHVPPPVEIEELVVDGKGAPFPRGGAEIHGRSVEVEYTALSLTSPETVRFRYMLEPVNRQWVDAKATRRMGFVNLGPGHYRFHVTACNNDGECNPTGAALAFTIDPRFYQTWWFATLVGLSLVMTAYGAHRRRVYRLKSSFRLVLQERTRLTRELHDTLLQGFAGVVYQLEAASRQMTADPAAGKKRLDRALEQADQSLLEARQMLSCMRISALEGRTLEEALRAAGEQITDGTPIHVELSVSGKARELPYEVQACLYIVGREAINNAANHARPDRIAVLLAYGNNAVSLSVRDNGQGFDVETSAVKTDHWGLAGMRERAVHAGGSLKIESSPGCGTTVEIAVENLGRQSAATSSP